MRRAVLALLLLLALAPGAALAAQPRASFNDVEDEVMCDTCNVPLNIAESARADQERAEIRRLIARGLTKQQILAELKATYVGVTWRFRLSANARQAPDVGARSN
jgi:cytochrome c-type biogenesis protein CcmH/NrfF